MEIIKNFIIIDYDENPNHPEFTSNDLDFFINRSVLIGSGIIVLGKYNNKRLKLISLFHEIGHTRVDKQFMELVKYDSYSIERRAWLEDLKLAKQEGITFTISEIKWAIKQLSTYNNENTNQ